jgi:hypothetical protein
MLLNLVAFAFLQIQLDWPWCIALVQRFNVKVILDDVLDCIVRELRAVLF